MKKFALLVTIIFLSMLVLPLAAVNIKTFSVKNIRDRIDESAEKSGKTVPERLPESVKVLAVSSGNIIDVSSADYLVGCVACEMPATYHKEALKAQAVAAYTNLLRLKAHPDEALGGADISDSPSKHQGFYTVEQQKQKWGDRYEEYSKKITEAVNDVLGEALYYDGQPIVAAYCAICPGRTESAEVIWSSDIPYLQSVPSPGDTLSPSYSSVLVLSDAQFREAALKEEGVKLSDNADEWVKNTVTSPNGTGVIVKITLGGKELSGNSFRKLFSLRSPAFKISHTGGYFTFEVSGYGHCVGMSQYGADYMAQGGSGYKEILRHYYQGVEIKKG